MNARGTQRSGMTMIEVMVAVAILGMISTMIWGGFSQTTKNKQRVEQQLDRYHIVRVALERMARELSMAYVSAQVNRSPTLQVIKTAFIGHDEGEEDRVDFTSFSHQRLYRDAHESDQNEISYFVTDHPTKSGTKVLARREQSRVDDHPERGGRTEILVEDIKGLELEYLDPLSGEWTKTWDTTQGAMQPNRLPTQVRILLTLPDPENPNRREQTFGTRAIIQLPFALNHAIYSA